MCTTIRLVVLHTCVLPYVWWSYTHVYYHVFWGLTYMCTTMCLGVLHTCVLPCVCGSEWKLPLRGRITYRHCRQPKLPSFLYSSNTTFWRLMRRANNNDNNHVFGDMTHMCITICLWVMYTCVLICVWGSYTHVHHHVFGGLAHMCTTIWLVV